MEPLSKSRKARLSIVLDQEAPDSSGVLERKYLWKPLTHFPSLTSQCFEFGGGLPLPHSPQ